MGMMQEFKEFAMKGNVVDLAVAVLIGNAFGKIVEAFTNGIINPMLNAVGGNPNVPLKIGIFDIGMVLNAAIAFLTTALVLFFVFVKPMQRMMKKKDDAAQ